MNPHRRHLLLAGALLPMAAGAQEALRLGLTPYLSPAALLAAYRPLREHLERQFGQAVETYTARDFRAMTDTIRRAEVDIALMPAHLARIAVADWRWAPLAGTLASTPVLVLVRGAGPVRSVADLRGRPVGMLDLLSLSAAVGVRWLDEQGLGGPGGAEVVTTPSMNSALIALERDELAAVVATANQMASLPAQVPTGQRRLASIENIRALVFAARPGTADDTARRWRQALLAFEPDTSKPLTVSNTRLVPLGANELEAQEPYAAFLRRQLANGR